MNILSGLILGWVGGIIVNYLADVLPYERRISYPTCRNCGQRFNLVNYIIYPRSCRKCKNHRTKRSWFVEVALVLLFLFVTIYSTNNLNLFIQFIIIVYFAMVTVIDIEHRLILNLSSIFGSIIGVVVGLILHGFRQTILGGLAGYITMLGLYWIGGVFISKFSRHRMMNNKIEALGYGDVTLGGVLGLFMGFPGVFLAIILAILSAGAISVVYILYKLLTRQYRSDLAIPYGPFLVFGAFALLFFNEHILNWVNW